MGRAEVTYFLGNSRPVHYLRGIAIRNGKLMDFRCPSI